MVTKALIVAACFVIGGCTTLSDYGSVRKEALKNDQGHVIGYKEMLRNQQTGEVHGPGRICSRRVLSEGGELLGYEEQARDGAIIRDINGRRDRQPLGRPAQPRDQLEEQGHHRRIRPGGRAASRGDAAEDFRADGFAVGLGSAPDPVTLPPGVPRKPRPSAAFLLQNSNPAAIV